MQLSLCIKISKLCPWADTGSLLQYIYIHRPHERQIDDKETVTR